MRKIPGIQRLYLIYLNGKFYLFQRHRHNRLALERIAGVPFLILPEVMNPKLFRTGEFLAQTLNSHLIPEGSKILDMGTGSGVGAVFAAKWATKIVAVDVNPAAVRCARINVMLNKLENKIEVREGDLFAPLKNEKFDVVVFNPPYLTGTPKTAFERAIWGEKVIESFALKLQDYLQPEGKALLVLSNLANIVNIFSYFKENGFELATISERRFINETLTLHSITQRLSVSNKTEEMNKLRSFT